MRTNEVDGYALDKPSTVNATRTHVPFYGRLLTPVEADFPPLNLDRPSVIALTCVVAFYAVCYLSSAVLFGAAILLGLGWI